MKGILVGVGLSEHGPTIALKVGDGETAFLSLQIAAIVCSQLGMMLDMLGYEDEPPSDEPKMH